MKTLTNETIIGYVTGCGCFLCAHCGGPGVELPTEYDTYTDTDEPVYEGPLCGLTREHATQDYAGVGLVCDNCYKVCLVPEGCEDEQR